MELSKRIWIFWPMVLPASTVNQALLRFVPHIQQLDMESWETSKDGEMDLYAAYDSLWQKGETTFFERFE